MKKLYIYMMCAAALLSACTEEVPVSREHPIDIEVVQPVFDTLSVAYFNLDGESSAVLSELKDDLAKVDFCLFAVSGQLDLQSVVNAWGHSVLAQCASAGRTYVATAFGAGQASVMTYSEQSAVIVRVCGTCFLVGSVAAEEVQALLDATIHVDESVDWVYHLTGEPDAEALYRGGFAQILENTIYAGSGVMSNISDVKIIPVQGMAGGLVRYVYQEEVL